MEPITLKANDHFCHIRRTIEIPNNAPADDVSPPPLPQLPGAASDQDISIDPNNQLSQPWMAKFRSLHQRFESVFKPTIGRYNDFSGKVRAQVNIGPVPPPTRKLRVPA